MKNNYHQVKWCVPPQIKTIITTKNGETQNNKYGAFNLALHVGDNENNVKHNRKLLLVDLPSQPMWLNQTHTDHILNLDNPPEIMLPSYDASFTRTANIVCAVMTADCIPVLLTDTKGSFVAAVHAGWRGVHNQIIIKTILLSKVAPKDIIVYMGPSIGQDNFEVGYDVYDLFVQQNPLYQQFFTVKNKDKFNCNLIGIASFSIEQLGVTKQHIYYSSQCTYTNNKTFYSYRKEKITGRFASLIWIAK